MCKLNLYKEPLRMIMCTINLSPGIMAKCSSIISTIRSSFDSQVFCYTVNLKKYLIKGKSLNIVNEGVSMMTNILHKNRTRDLGINEVSLHIHQNQIEMTNRFDRSSIDMNTNNGNFIY